MVIATLALIVAMSGAAYAALGKNSIGASQIKANAVRSAEVKNGSLRSGDFADDQLPAGPQGPQGATGPSDAFHSFDNGVIEAPAGFGYFKVGSLPLGPGRYVILAKASIENDNPADLGVVITCRLTTGAVEDRSSVGLQDSDLLNDFGDVALQLAVSLSANTTVNLECTNGGGAAGDTDVDHRRITAIRVASLSGGQ
jgi:hypothetical protein